MGVRGGGGMNRAAFDYFADLLRRESGLQMTPEKYYLLETRLLHIVQQDAPRSFGYFPYASGAAQSWVHNYKPAVLIRDQGRYLRLDVAERVRRLAAWNRPVWWPLLLMGAALAALAAYGWRAVRRRERADARGEVLA